MTYEHIVFGDSQLLSIPVKRAAWSDRAALLMAEMSKLAYCRFEEAGPGRLLAQAELDQAFERLMKLDVETTLDGSTDPDEEADVTPIPPEAIVLRRDLRRAGLELVGLFSDRSTDAQGFLASTEPLVGEPAPVAASPARPFGDEKVVILSFRGTRTAKDWRNNVKFRQRDVGGADVHSGFQDAFNAVRGGVTSKLQPFLDAGFTLYVTGHSLGGAMAMIATRELGPESAGACYTFGQPRVARFEFSRWIKTPIYRVVNSNDLVPRVPPAYLMTILVAALTILNVPLLGLLSRLIRKVERYVHHGDLRYLRRTPGDDFSDVRVVSNPSVVYRTLWYISALIRDWRSPVSNHDINLYAGKLAAYARRCLNGPFE